MPLLLQFLSDLFPASALDITLLSHCFNMTPCHSPANRSFSLSSMRVCVAVWQYHLAETVSNLFFCPPEKTRGSSCCVSPVRAGHAPPLHSLLRSHRAGAGQKHPLLPHPRILYESLCSAASLCRLPTFATHTLSAASCSFPFGFNFNSTVRFLDFRHVEMEYEELPGERLSRFWGKMHSYFLIIIWAEVIQYLRSTLAEICGPAVCWSNRAVMEADGPPKKVEPNSD